jgi:hypothetical protein
MLSLAQRPHARPPCEPRLMKTGSMKPGFFMGMASIIIGVLRLLLDKTGKRFYNWLYNLVDYQEVVFEMVAKINDLQGQKKQMKQEILRLVS